MFFPLVLILDEKNVILFYFNIIALLMLIKKYLGTILSK